MHMFDSTALDGLKIDLDDLAFLGSGLSRPESVICTRQGDIFTSHRPGGISWIRPDGTQTRIGDNPDLVPNGIALLADGSFLLANHTAEGGVYRLTRDGIATPHIIEVESTRLRSVNFVYRDHQQRIWLCVSSPRQGDDQYRFDVADGFLVLVEGGSARVVADGLCWTNECRLDAAGETLYVNETFGRRLTRFKVAPNGDLSERAVHTEFSRDTFPDGLALDQEGGCWIVAVASNRIIRVAPDGQQTILVEDNDPAHLTALADALDRNQLTRPMLMNFKSRKLRNISSIAFGGDDLRTVYIGCLGGNALATFRVPVAGLPQAHWTD